MEFTERCGQRTETLARMGGGEGKSKGLPVVFCIELLKFQEFCLETFSIFPGNNFAHVDNQVMLGQP